MSSRRFRPDELGDYMNTKLGDGGQGTVYAVPTPPLGLPGPLAYKEYFPWVAADPVALEDMAEFLDLLPAGERALLESQLAWPLAVSFAGARADGFLMQQVPDEFFIDSPVLGDRKPQGMEFLFNDPAYLQRLGLHVIHQQRLLLLKDLAGIVSALHRKQVAVGDLSPKNVLFTLVGRPRCLLIDCDSMRYRGRSALDQVETTGWEVPKGETLGTVDSDAYKFGLIAIRLFNNDQESRDPAALRAVSAPLGPLAERSQDRDPGRRPGVDEWIAPLDQALLEEQLRVMSANTQTIPQPVPQPAAQAQAPVPGFVIPQPTPYPQPTPVSQPKPPSRVFARIVVPVMALLVLTGVIVGANQLASRPSSADGPTGTTAVPGLVDPSTGQSDTGETVTDPPSPAPTTPAAVTVDAGLVEGDPQAAGVTQMLQSFYTAVNDKQYAKALTYYDPETKAVDLGTASGRASWSNVMSTTFDEDFRVTDISDSGRYTLVTFSFRSHQAQGYGPASHPDQTCTDWNEIDYLTRHGSGYRLLKATLPTQPSGC